MDDKRSTQLPDAEEVAQLLMKDGGKLELLERIFACRGLLYAYAFCFLRGYRHAWDSVEDLVQDFLLLLHRLPILERYDSTRSSFSYYLLQINLKQFVLARGYEIQRQAQTHSQLDPEELSGSADLQIDGGLERLLLAKELRELLDEFAETLSKPDAEILASYLQEEPRDAVAARLGLKSVTGRVRLVRMKARLRDFLIRRIRSNSD